MTDSYNQQAQAQIYVPWLVIAVHSSIAAAVARVTTAAGALGVNQWSATRRLCAAHAGPTVQPTRIGMHGNHLPVEWTVPELCRYHRDPPPKTWGSASKAFREKILKPRMT